MIWRSRHMKECGERSKNPKLLDLLLSWRRKTNTYGLLDGLLKSNVSHVTGESTAHVRRRDEVTAGELSRAQPGLCALMPRLLRRSQAKSLHQHVYLRTSVESQSRLFSVALAKLLLIDKICGRWQSCVQTQATKARYSP